ncbi:MAG: Rpn family recombination-promoting nuclease/putative transposase [Eubacterium sp.]|nr:Rpn family recombination-promoting nuclease/putative transposase [Eubacterium sp.]
MGKKDITEKKLEDFTDVFADIVNVLLFNGDQRVDSRELRNALPRSIYKIEGEISEQERDVAKYWQSKDTCFALLGLENQTEAAGNTPLRIISYDGADYRAQIRKRDDVIRYNAKAKGEQDKKPMPVFYPVVTLVLYFGLERWDKSINLKACFTIPEGLEDYVNDYQINLFEIAFMDDETVEKFRSDFKLVAQYFTQSRKIKEGNAEEYSLSTDDIIHVKEVMELMSALTGDRAFEEAYNDSLEGGKIPMWTLIDYVREKGEKSGFDKGEKSGFEKGEKNKLVKNLQTVMVKMDCSLDQAMDFLDVSEVEREALREMI